MTDNPTTDEYLLRAAGHFHKMAMELADRCRYQQAYRFESNAASYLFLRPDLEPSRSVLYRSAASLALQCGYYRQAKRCAKIGLNGNPPAEIADELKEVLRKCDDR